MATKKTEVKKQEKKQTLFAINDELKEFLLVALDPDTGEILPEHEKKLDALLGNKSSKLDSYLYIIKKLEKNGERIDAEIARLQKWKKRESNTIAGMLTRVRMVLEEGEKYESLAGAFTWRKSSQLKKHETFTPESIYKTHRKLVTKEVPKPMFILDSKKAKEEILAGKEIPGLSVLKLNNVKAV